jgi:hypothetical protein
MLQHQHGHETNKKNQFKRTIKRKKKLNHYQLAIFQNIQIVQ